MPTPSTYRKYHAESCIEAAGSEPSQRFGKAVNLGDFTFFGEAAGDPPQIEVPTPDESHAGLASVQCRDLNLNGRALACLCGRGKFLSITMRGKGAPGSWELRPSTGYAAGESIPLASFKFTCEYEPADFQPSKPQYPVSFRHICETLDERLFHDNQRPEGLIVISGTTGTGKSQVARGLIQLYLGRCQGLSRSVPHLLTIEDPIEVPYISLKKPSEDQDAASKRRYEELAKFWKLGEGGMVPPWFVQGYPDQMLDYTPREIGTDTSCLSAALQDALRQTPTVVYIGEARNRKALREAIKFAGTGHLVIFTMHAGSLSETVAKLLDASDAETPAERGFIANRILGVVNLWKVPNLVAKRPSALGGAAETVFAYDVKVPMVWVRGSSTVAALVSDGLASIVPGSFRSGCIGRAAMAEKLCERVATARGGSPPGKESDASRFDSLSDSPLKWHELERLIKARSLHTDLEGC